MHINRDNTDAGRRTSDGLVELQHLTCEERKKSSVSFRGPAYQCGTGIDAPVRISGSETDASRQITESRVELLHLGGGGTGAPPVDSGTRPVDLEAERKLPYRSAEAKRRIAANQ